MIHHEPPLSGGGSEGRDAASRVQESQRYIQGEIGKAVYVQMRKNLENPR
ncbi:hypothetical protein GCM10027040_25280 [Halomonas shantousis]